MDSQAKQKATHDVHAKFREFYPGVRVLVRDLRKEDTWWPGSVAERSGSRLYVVALNDGRVWKCYFDHVRREVRTGQYQTLTEKWNLRTNLPILQ